MHIFLKLKYLLFVFAILLLLTIPGFAGTVETGIVPDDPNPCLYQKSDLENRTVGAYINWKEPWYYYYSWIGKDSSIGGSYVWNGNRFAYMGAVLYGGQIKFTNGFYNQTYEYITVNHVDLLTSTNTNVIFSAYDVDNVLIDTASASSNYNTFTLTRITLTGNGISSVWFNGSEPNKFLVDDICSGNIQEEESTGCSIIDLPCNLQSFWDWIVGLYNSFTSVIFGAINSIFELAISIVSFIYLLLSIIVNIIFLLLTLTQAVVNIFTNTIGVLFGSNAHATTVFGLMLMTIFYPSFIRIWNILAEISLWGYKLPKLPERK